ncbi:MAG: Medium-chain acyl-CoA ligase (AlkK-3) [Archaeoglobus fulgidus]|uniref:Medium-chain acyl-CoA ligase (AlkK-3) n=1 Tax=Archaeoglobus fulgidus TaxID=2234 RepID=A0A124F8C1_ARCFL|nr:MAG: Medium-chain acyl-CoA ligase (AlkK-3) [Archaeoglobus fulgidus]KUK07534.1 MAG: Medium-chain acyl-CoA ligase (AlkK-3) [Archaeoglobus fulgidus]
MAYFCLGESVFTIPYLLERAAKLFPNKGVVGREGTKSYSEVRKRVLGLTAFFENIGIRNEVVAVADWNTPEFFELIYAITAAGGILYPVNIRLPPDQIAYTLKKSESGLLIYSDDFSALAKVHEGESLHIKEVAEKAEEAEPEVNVKQDDMAVMLFTSGTTGLPKAVRYTHEKMIHGALSIAHQLAHHETPANLTPRDVIFPQIPIYHILAWGTVFIAPYMGLNLVMGGRFDPAEAVRLIKKEGVTWINAVPTMVNMLLETKEDLSGIKVLIGGSTITIDLARRMEKAGMKFSTIYGGTDMLAASIAIMTEEAKVKGVDYIRQVTHPVPFAEFKIVPQEGMGGESGEIYFRAPWLPMEYYKDEEKTKEAYTEDGWFKTGDLGVEMPDGGVKILDRVKDAIKSGGEWIPSSILESVISEIEWVEYVAVLGKPDEKWGERPFAVIKPVDRSKASIEEVKEHLAKAVEEGRIAKWWIPEEIAIVDDMPLTSTGKINKLSLRKMLLER